MLRGPSELSCQFWESSEIDSCERLFFQRASDLDPVGITALVRKPASLPPRLFQNRIQRRVLEQQRPTPPLPPPLRLKGRGYSLAARQRNRGLAFLRPTTPKRQAARRLTAQSIRRGANRQFTLLVFTSLAAWKLGWTYAPPGVKLHKFLTGNYQPSHQARRLPTAGRTHPSPDEPHQNRVKKKAPPTSCGVVLGRWQASGQ